MKPPLKVLLVTGRPIMASRIGREISALDGLEVVGTASDLSQAYILAEGHEPKVTIISPEVMRQPEFEGLLSLLRVIGSGWLPIQTEPAQGSATSVAAGYFSDRTARNPPLHPGMPPEALRQALLDAAKATAPRVIRPDIAAPSRDPAPSLGEPAPYDPDKIILIGASTGGIDALLTILSAFPAHCPPTAIVQHTGAAFSASLIRLFARCTAARVVTASPGIAFQPGQIIVGAGCPGHLQLSAKRPIKSEVVPGPLITGHLPSVDALFRSALHVAPHVVAALLTGMGRDGAQGLLDLRRAGAMTIAQNEASAVVYGMPKAAVELGAAQMILPLERIAPMLLKECQSKQVSPLVMR